jgi:hypothetical protein
LIGCATIPHDIHEFTGTVAWKTGIGFGTLGNTFDAGCVLVEAALAGGYRYTSGR